MLTHETGLGLFESSAAETRLKTLEERTAVHNPLLCVTVLGATLSDGVAPFGSVQDRGSGTGMNLGGRQLATP